MIRNRRQKNRRRSVTKVRRKRIRKKDEADKIPETEDGLFYLENSEEEIDTYLLTTAANSR